jgi:hypothetical protein
MKNMMGLLGAFIVGWLILTLALALFTQSRDFYGPNPILRPRLEVKEPFQNGGATVGITDVVGAGLQLQPGDPALGTPRAPYALLNLPTTTNPTVLTAQECHEADFATRLEKTGNFRQMTNNYRHGDPDSCSGWTEELNMAIYKTEPLPQNGCI